MEKKNSCNKLYLFTVNAFLSQKALTVTKKNQAKLSRDI